MSHYYQPDNEELVTCPYNKSEKMAVKKLTRHLTRCPHRKASTVEFESCPYYALHIIPRSEYKQHLTTCPARVVAEKAINYELEKQNENLGRVKLKGCTDIPEYNTYDIQCSENWDDDESDDVKPYIYQLAPNTVPDNISEKSEMDSGIDVQDLLEIEFNEPEDRRYTRPHQGRDRRQDKPVRKPKQAPSVFQYSLKMAGVNHSPFLPGQAVPQILQDSGIAQSLVCETFEDESLDFMISSNIDDTLACEILENESFDSKPLDMNPKVTYKMQDVRPKYEICEGRTNSKYESQDVRLNSKFENPDVRPKVKHRSQDVRPRVKHEKPDVRPKFRKGREKDSGDHLTAGQNFKADPDVRPKVRQNQSSDLNFPARDINQTEISLPEHSRNLGTSEESLIKDCGQLPQGEGSDANLQSSVNLGSSEESSIKDSGHLLLGVGSDANPQLFVNPCSSKVPPKTPSGQLPPGAGRGAILQYLLSKNSQNLSPSGLDLKPKTLAPIGHLLPPHGVGRGALAQYIMGKIPVEPSLESKTSVNPKKTSSVSPQGFGRGMFAFCGKKVLANRQAKEPLTDGCQEMLAQVLNDQKVPTNHQAKEPKADSCQEMLAKVLNDQKVPANRQAKEPLADGSQGMLAQVLNENQVSENSELKASMPKSTPHISEGKVLDQVIVDKGGLTDPALKFQPVKESDDEEDFMPKFEGIGRGARLRNGNQDPRLYPPALGRSLNNKNFEYAKN